MNAQDTAERAYKNGFDRGVEALAEKLKGYIVPSDPKVSIIDNAVKELTKGVRVEGTVWPDNLLSELCIKDVNESTVKNLNTLMEEELSAEQKRIVEMRYKYKMTFVNIAQVILFLYVFPERET